jgi:hypothetical protein
LIVSYLESIYLHSKTFRFLLIKKKIKKNSRKKNQKGITLIVGTISGF